MPQSQLAYRYFILWIGIDYLKPDPFHPSFCQKIGPLFSPETPEAHSIVSKLAAVRQYDMTETQHFALAHASVNTCTYRNKNLDWEKVQNSKFYQCNVIA